MGRTVWSVALRARLTQPRESFAKGLCGPALLLLGYLSPLLDALRPADTWMAIAQIAVLFGFLLRVQPRSAIPGPPFAQVPSSTITLLAPPSHLA